MKKTLMRMLMIAASAAVLLLPLAACGKKEAAEEPAGQESAEEAEKEEAPEETIKTFIDVREDGGAVAYFEKTEKGTGGGTGITIEGGKYLVIDTELMTGKVHVRVFRGGTDIETPPTQEAETPAAIDYVFEGIGTTEYMEIQPGDYMFNVEVEEMATGTITASMREIPAATADAPAEPAGEVPADSAAEAGTAH